MARLSLLLIAASLVGLAALPAGAVDKYQFMKATEDRVWRLNKVTGEIAVCTLQGERLLCTHSSEAATPPPRSYAEIKAAEQVARTEAREEQARKEEKGLQILTRILDFFKEMIAMAKDKVAE